MMKKKSQIYFVGDVVRLVDGLDYTGDSLSYQEGFNTEILKIKNGEFHVYRFYRPVEKEEIKERIYTNIQKQTLFGEYLEKIGDTIWISKYNSENEFIYKPVKIHGFDFEYEEFMYSDGKIIFRVGDNPFFSELDAWKDEALHLRKKILGIQKIL